MDLPQAKVSIDAQSSAAAPLPAKGTNAELPLRKPRAPAQLAPLERRLRQKLARGRAAPEAAIDLHGMRRQDAFFALRGFLLRAQSEDARLVLVVTGKGERPKSGESIRGILRTSVPNWLRGEEFRSIVAGFEEAARPHGGSGALYVRLRRRYRGAVGKPQL
jgi:DNA-nicking Smr family endonuclease